MLKENGIFILVGGEFSQLFQTMTRGSWLSLVGKRRFTTFMQKPNQEDLMLMKALIEEGKVKPIIDRTYSLSEVPKAFQYFEEGHSQGKVIIVI